MKFVKECFIYKVVYMLFLNSYNTSVLKNVIGKIENCFCNSYIYKLFYNYFHKEPYFIDSISYKIFRKFIGIIDLVMDKINKLIFKIINASKAYQECKFIVDKSNDKKMAFLSLICVSTVFGYCIGLVLFGKEVGIIAPIILVIVIFSLIIYKRKDILLKIFKQSVIFKYFL